MDHPDSSLEAIEACLFCGSAGYSAQVVGVRDYFFAADEGSFEFRRCDRCRSLWLSTRPIGDRLEKAYAGYYTHDTPEAAPGRGLRAVLKDAFVESRFGKSPSPAARILPFVTRLTGLDTSNLEAQYRFAPRASATILDYGCGSGAYLKMMARFENTLAGVEYDPALLASLAGEGIEIVDVAEVARQPWEGRFDHITLAHVLEHVPDPSALLGRLHSWLKPGGTLFIELPNADATGLAIFGRYWRGLEAPRHFALPSRAALIDALEAAGFRVERQKIMPTVRKWVWRMSLDAAPPEERGALREEIASAPTENETNAEFLTVLASRGRAR